MKGQAAAKETAQTPPLPPDNPVLQSIRSVSSLLFSYGLLLVANGMFATLLGLRSKMEGFSTEVIGLVMSGFFIGLLIGGLYAVRAVAAVGHIRSFAAFASIMSVAVLTHVLIIDPFMWFGLRVAAGFCMAGMVMVTESWLNERATNQNRGRILSLYMMIHYLGSGVGQFVLNVADPARFQLFVIASIIYSLALVPILLTRANAPKPSSPQRMKFSDLYAISPLGVIATVLAGMANATVNSMGPVFAKENGLSVAGVSTFMACLILGGMVLQLPMGRLSDRLDRRTVLIIAALASLLGCAAIILAAGQPGPMWLFVAAAIYGGFCFAIYPIAAAQVNDMADPDRLIQVASGLLVAYGVGASIGPVISSQLMGRIGPSGMFMFNGAIAGGLALFAAWRMIRRHPGVKAKARFLPLGFLGASSKQLYNAALDTITRKRAAKNSNRGEDKEIK